MNKKLLLLAFLIPNLSFAEYIWPTKFTKNINGTLGEYRGTGSRDHFHSGTDFYTNAKGGQKVQAIVSGKIGYLFNGSRTFYINDGNGTLFYYYHTDIKDSVASEGEVKKGEDIGTSEDMTDAHLHLEKRIGNKRFNILTSGGVDGAKDDRKTSVCPIRPQGEPFEFYSFRSNNNGQYKETDRIKIGSNLNVVLSGKVDIIAKVADRKNFHTIGQNICDYTVTGRTAPYKICYNLKNNNTNKLIFGSDGICNITFDYLIDDDGDKTFTYTGLSNVYDITKSDVSGNLKNSTYFYSITNKQAEKNPLDTTRYADGNYDLIVWADDFDGGGYDKDSLYIDQYRSGAGFEKQTVYIKNNNTNGENDLSVESVSVVSSTYNAGEQIDIDVSIRNKSSTTSQFYDLKVYATKDRSFNEGYLLTKKELSGVSGGKVAKYNIKASPENFPSSGEYYIGVQIDVLNDANLSDNTGFSTNSITIQKSSSSVDTPITTSPGSATDTNEIINTLQPTFRWESDGIGIDHFKLYISKSPYGASNLVYNEKVYGTSKNLPSGVLEKGTKYRWNMSAVDSDGNQSLVSSRRYFTTFTDTRPPPSTPSSLSASDDTYTDKVRVTWADVSNADYYELHRCTTSSTSLCGALSNNATSPYDDTSAIAGVGYYYRVKACNSTGCSDYSGYDRGSKAEEDSSDVPAIPNKPSASDGTYENKVRVTWDTDPDVTHYKLVVCTTSSLNSCGRDFNNTSGSFTDYPDDSAVYYYRIKACNDNGCSDYSNYDAGNKSGGESGEPDLVVLNPEVSDSTPEKGQSINVSVDIKNVGDANSSSSRTRFYISSDSTITTSDDEKESESTGTLNVNEVDNESQSFTAPTEVGRYWVGACIDAVSDESDTGNNCSAGMRIDVEEDTASGDDFSFEQVTVDKTSVEAGGSLALYAKEKYVGSRTADRVENTIAYILRSKNDSSIADVYLADDVGVPSNGSTSGKRETVTIPANTKAGQYYIVFIADYPNAFAETNENNNVEKVEILVTGAVEVPDLVVTGANASHTTLKTEQTFVLDYSVKNIGNANQVVSGTKNKSTFYQSTDSTIDTSDTIVAESNAVGLLRSGEEKSFTRLLKTGTEEGIFWYGVCLSDVEGETSIGNNCSVGSRIEVKTPTIDKADLIVKEVSITGGTLISGQSVDLGAVVKNIGTISFPQASIKYFLSIDSVIDIGDTQIGFHQSVGDIDSGSEATSSETINLPSIVGQYWYGACAEVSSNESDIDNNCSTGISVTIEDNIYPDLEVVSVVPKNIVAVENTNVDFEVVIKNSGGSGSTVTQMKIMATGKTHGCGSGVTIYSSDVPAMVIGAEKTIKATIPASLFWNEQILTVNITASENETVTENNCFTGNEIKVSPITAKADLTVSASVSQTQVIPNKPIDIIATVKNKTAIDSLATRLKYYVSADSTVDINDTEIGNYTISAVLKNTQLDKTFSIFAPSEEGTYWYGACVDTFDNELRSDNNCSSSIKVTVKKAVDTKPDYVIENLKIDKASYTKEDEISASLNVKNIGTKDGDLLLGISCYIGTEENKRSKKVCDTATTRDLTIQSTEEISQKISLTNIADGNYILTVVVDESNSASELNEDNNETSSITFVIAEPDADTDSDGVKDEIDNCPTESNEDQLDTDSNKVGDACDSDRDGDGMDNDWENENGLDPLDASDATKDADGDGESNLEEFENNTNPNVDTVVPEISHSGKVILKSTGTVTSFELSLFKVVASDIKDGELVASVELVNGKAPVVQSEKISLESGRHTIVWKATDSAENTATVEQVVDVLPQVDFSLSQSGSEGQSLTVKALLSGKPPQYPVTVPLVVSGSATVGDDFTLSAQEIVISAGREGVVKVELVKDQVSESDEQIIVTIGDGIIQATKGNISEHTITIVANDKNITPKIAGFTIEQDGLKGRKVSKAGGTAVIYVNASDVNNDDLEYTWTSSYFNNLDTDSSPSTFEFDPSQSNVGIFISEVKVSDGEFSVARNVPIEIIAKRASHTGSADSDGDGIADKDEPDDKDNNGVPDYDEKPHSESELSAGGNAVIRSPVGTKIIVGIMGGDSGKITKEHIQSYLSDNGLGQYQQDTEEKIESIYSYSVEGLQKAGESIPIIIALDSPVPESATVRKYSPETGWRDFAIDGKNIIESVKRADTLCPENSAWKNSLLVGATCLKLTIEDGGLNDADGKRNGSIDDPVAISSPTPSNEEEEEENETEQEVSSSGGGGVVSLFWIIALLVFVRYRRVRESFLHIR